MLSNRWVICILATVVFIALLVGSFLVKRLLKTKVTTTTSTNGRLGNQIIRNLCVSLLARKNDLKVNYSSFDRIHNCLGIPLYVGGTKTFLLTQRVNNDNFLKLLYGPLINKNLNANGAYFQSHEISLLLYDLLRTPEVYASVKISNPFRERYGQENCCVHMRLTDAANHFPGLEYYVNTLSRIPCQKIFVATDDAHNSVITHFLQKEQRAEILTDMDEVQTLQLCSTCKYLVLSHGSYSAVMGWLAYNASEVHYLEYDAKQWWHGDMFSIPNWIKESKTQVLATQPLPNGTFYMAAMKSTGSITLVRK